MDYLVKFKLYIIFLTIQIKNPRQSFNVLKKIPIHYFGNLLQGNYGHQN